MLCLWFSLAFGVCCLLIGLVFLMQVRILRRSRKIMDKLQALLTAVAALQTDVTALAAAGLVPAAALDPITATIEQLDTQVKALLPATA